MRVENELEIVLTTQKKEQDGPQRWALLAGVFDGPEIPMKVRERITALSPVKIDNLIKNHEISGIFKEYTLLHVPEGRKFKKIIMMGLGSKKRFDLDAVRSIAARAARTLRKVRCPEMVVYPSDFPGLPTDQVARALVEGVALGTYRVHVYRKSEVQRPELEKLIVVLDDNEESEAVINAVHYACACSTACNAAKDLVNEPADRLTPDELAKYAVDIGRKYDFSVEVFDEKQLKEQGFGGIVAVGAGSMNPPRLVVMRYNDHVKDAPFISLVGKGVTFDSGGISIKPAHKLHEMKYDMAGAAAVICTMRAIARLKLPVRVMGFVPTAENLLGSAAYRPGDVVKTWSGTQVEIINTDAEGRMLLADALAYASSFKPDLIIDLATLTGGVIIALGHMTTGLMCNNERLAKDLERAGQIVLERVWRLPLFREYAVQLKSIVADLMNEGGRPASAVTAGLFLRQFVDRPWAHLDIAGTAWIDESTIQYFHRPYQPKRGATGIGVRLLMEYIKTVLQDISVSKQSLQDRLAHDESLLDDPVGTLTMPQGGW